MQPPVWAGLGGCGPGAAALAGPVGLAAHAVGPQRPWPGPWPLLGASGAGPSSVTAELPLISVSTYDPVGQLRISGSGLAQ